MMGSAGLIVSGVIPLGRAKELGPQTGLPFLDELTELHNVTSSEFWGQALEDG